MQRIKKRICVIKLDGMGDVLRTTPILWRFKNDDVTWITKNESMPLLNNNILIKTVIPVSETPGIKNSVFDELYNFDEDKEACLAAINIKAEKKKGYGLKNCSYAPFDSDCEYAYELSRNDELKFRLNKKTYQQVIFEISGFKWMGEDYILGYKPKSKIQYQVGINYLVGEKFPNKAWPFWRELSGMLDSVSVQKRFSTLEEYIEWINSCRVLVTSDSLGMHIALALKKQVIILMGSTSQAEIETYNRGIILASHLPCSPCYKKDKCSSDPFCMNLISPERVHAEIMKLDTYKPGPETRDALLNTETQ